MDKLDDYLEQIVEPTFREYELNPGSARLAFLACVATFHAVDRASYPRKVATLRAKWRKECVEFSVVDMVAHHFKHVRSSNERIPVNRPGIPFSSVVFRNSQRESANLGSSMDLRNLYFAVREAIRFVRRQANEPKGLHGPSDGNTPPGVP